MRIIGRKRKIEQQKVSDDKAIDEPVGLNSNNKAVTLIWIGNVYGNLMETCRY